MEKKPDIDDRFKKFGTVSFTGISKTNDFIDYLQKGQVMGTPLQGLRGWHFSRPGLTAVTV